MLTIKKLTNAHQASVYYEHDDYYVQGRLVAPSRWWGEGARRLRLSGEVDRDKFRELLEGRLPNGDAIDTGGDGTHSPGLDLTFSAPKSVSLLALVHKDERVLRAHDAAVTVALKHLQATTGRVRTRRGGVLDIEETDNLVVARFNHDSSRALDPQLHSHCVVLNMTKRADKQWKALANQEIYRAHRAVGAVYRAELAAKLRTLGYGIERTHADGRFEVAGFSREVLDAFSQRRAQIEHHLEEKRHDGARAARVAAVATRDAKQDVDRAVLHQDWTDRARELGVDFEQTRDRSRAPDKGQRRTRADEVLDQAVEHLTERKVVAPERRIIQHALGLGMGEVRLADLQRAIERKVEACGIVAAVSTRQPDPFARHYTTNEALMVERDLIHLMERGQGRERPLASTEIEQRIAAIDRQEVHRLTNGQAGAIRLALTTEDRVVGIQGYAGTGKTTGALLHIRRLAEAEGLEVRGFAPSAAAADILQRDANIPSMTLARFLASKQEPTTKPQLWIVDEASMMANKTARAFLEVAQKANARVILVGDRDQLPAIEAGRPFGLLMDRGMKVAKIETIVRQKDQQIRKAVEKTIQRDHEAALEAVKPRIVELKCAGDRLKAIAKAYVTLPESDREGALVVTPLNQDRRVLNRMIRNGLRAKKQLGAEQLDANILVAKNLTRAQTRDILCYDTTDVIRFNARYTRLGVRAGDYWNVKAIDFQNEVVTLEKAGREIRWKPSKATQIEAYHREDRQLAVGDLIRWTRNDRKHGRTNAELGRIIAIDLTTQHAEVRTNGKLQTLDLRQHRHWEHAYASTLHAAQGRTADRVLLHLDSKQSHLLGHEGWYVGISRAKKDIQIFTEDKRKLPKEIGVSIQQEAALDVDLHARRHEKYLALREGARVEREAEAIQKQLEPKLEKKQEKAKPERQYPGYGFGFSR